MADHATFSPSSSARWMTCAASYPLHQQQPSTKFAAEGTAAHTLAGRAFTYKKPCAFWIGEQIQADSFVFVVDQEMADYVQQYVDYVYSLTQPDDTLLIEQKLEFSEAIGVPDQFGTGDAVLLKASGTHLDVIDLKYGMGERVDAEENTQGLTYAVAALETYAPVFPDVETITIHIHQPRLDHVTVFETDRARVEQHAKDIRAAAVACLAAELDAECGEIDPVHYNPTDKACRWCSHKPHCDALRQKVADEVYGDFKALDDPSSLAVGPAPRVPAGERLGAIFGVLDLIEDWTRAVRGEVERMVQGGMTVVGPDGLPMKLIEGKKGNRSWTDAAAAEAALVGLLPPEKAYRPREIITPSAADKLLNKKATKLQWETLVPLVTQAPGRPKVVMGSHPGAPYQPSATEAEFANLDAPQ